MSIDVPVISFPPELPVSQRREDIARAISQNQVVIVAGATGSGKTTQLPKICLELGRTSIGHTQNVSPRSWERNWAAWSATRCGSLIASAQTRRSS